jgi:hypothetical protein
VFMSLQELRSALVQVDERIAEHKSVSPRLVALVEARARLLMAIARAEAEGAI